MKLKKIVRKRPRTGTKTTKTFISKFTGMIFLLFVKKHFVLCMVYPFQELIDYKYVLNPIIIVLTTASTKHHSRYYYKPVK